MHKKQAQLAIIRKGVVPTSDAVRAQALCVESLA